jgi:hypothetical protein
VNSIGFLFIEAYTLMPIGKLSNLGWVIGRFDASSSPGRADLKCRWQVAAAVTSAPCENNS